MRGDGIVLQRRFKLLADAMGWGADVHLVKSRFSGWAIDRVADDGDTRLKEACSRREMLAWVDGALYAAAGPSKWARPSVNVKTIISTAGCLALISAPRA